MIQNDREHVYRSIDEARIKEVESEQLLRLRELEIEEKDKERERKTRYVAFGIAFAFLLGGAFIAIFNETAGMFGILIAMMIAAYTIPFSQKKKRRILSNDHQVQISDKMSRWQDKNYNTISMLFRTAGFVNVTEIPLHDLNMFNQMKNGQIEEVMINGEDDFDEGDIFSKDAKVMITYHCK
ncbi:MAG: hypothetical protein PUB12_04485 [[Clostridium] aminophilum]|uniref:hypothetical protein n=1 Tax=[Clostridium] aminophilum TaxID=1526 RepID=UPI0026EEA776|nr:hypothetical protein [[Clostridium] aminophilum]MDD6196126.1 hypothetical protein [[Clostridium] aminophilum]